MDQITADTIIKIAALSYNLTLVMLASYLVAIHGWSLLTFVGFAFFMVSTSKSDKDD